VSGGLRFAPAPPNVSFVPAERELVSVGPLPLYLSGGGQAPGHPIPLPEASGGVYFIRFRECGTESSGWVLPSSSLLNHFNKKRLPDSK